MINALAPSGPPRWLQLPPVKAPLVWIWYGGRPPVQLNANWLPCREIERLIGAITFKFILACPENPPRSVTLTKKMLVPESALAGVPEIEPLPATASQAGPLILAKVRTSPTFGSVA